MVQRRYSAQQKKRCFERKSVQLGTAQDREKRLCCTAQNPLHKRHGRLLVQMVQYIYQKMKNRDITLFYRVIAFPLYHPYHLFHDSPRRFGGATIRKEPS